MHRNAMRTIHNVNIADRIYLDYAATAPLLPEVRAAMEPWLNAGNASSLYAEGRKAKAAIDEARERISNVFESLFAEILFTSSGTEAANMAIIGAALGNQDKRRTRILLGASEHHCVLNCQPILERLGYTVQLIPVNRFGVIDLNWLEDNIGDDVLLVSAMHANNEFGTIFPTKEISTIAKRSGALLFVDAIQTYRKLDWTANDLGADLISISAHKIGGPKGAGALYIRAGTQVKPLLNGGGQEREMRGGTENVAAIVGFGESTIRTSPKQNPVIRDLFENELMKRGATATAQTENRLSGHCHVRFPGIQAETMLIALDRLGLSASSGAACSSGSIEPSHVMLAAGYTLDEAKEGLRFTFGPETKEQEANKALEIIDCALKQVRTA
ncbi:cysteine desulfurase NifS [soil metagenome]